MHAIKEKINDIKEIRKAKAEAKEEEKAERELAKSRLEVAREVRMAKEAEAAMDFHVQKAAEKAAEHEKKFPAGSQSGHGHSSHGHSSHGHSQHDLVDDDLNTSARSGGSSARHSGNIYSDGAPADSGHHTTFLDAPSAPVDATDDPAGRTTRSNRL